MTDWQQPIWGQSGDFDFSGSQQSGRFEAKAGELIGKILIKGRNLANLRQLSAQLILGGCQIMVG